MDTVLGTCHDVTVQTGVGGMLARVPAFTPSPQAAYSPPESESQNTRPDFKVITHSLLFGMCK